MRDVKETKDQMRHSRRRKRNNRLITIRENAGVYLLKRILCAVFIVSTIILSIVTINLIKENRQLISAVSIIDTNFADHRDTERTKKYINDLKESKDQSDESLLKLANENQSLKEGLMKTYKKMHEQDLQNASLIASNDEYFKELSDLRERKELYDKYNYAFYNQRGERTDITFDQLTTAEEIMEDVNPKAANLVLAFVMAESDGNKDAKNPSSTATGYGQVLYGTGKTVYEDYMGNGKGSFKTSMLMDGDKNIAITSNYIKRLIKDGHSIYQVIEGYYPLAGSAYCNKLEKFLKKGGTSLAEMDTIVKSYN